MYLAACSSVGAWLITDQCGVAIADGILCALADKGWPVEGLYNLTKMSLLRGRHRD